MTAAATWNIVCDQGKTFIRTIQYGSIVSNTFVPFDNTSWDARMQLRTTYTSEDVVVDLSSTAGDIFLSGETGEVTITISSDIMANLLGKYVYDLELYQGSNPEIVRSPVRGEIIVRPETTK
jgi:hypothetical protein